MRYLVPTALVLVATIHALPSVGVFSATKVSTLYGVAIQDANLEILMRHRAVLFGLLAAFLAYAAFHRRLHGLALVVGSISVVAFLVLALLVGGYNESLSLVVKADLLAAFALAVAAVQHLRISGEA